MTIGFVTFACWMVLLKSYHILILQQNVWYSGTWIFHMCSPHVDQQCKTSQWTRWVRFWKEGNSKPLGISAIKWTISRCLTFAQYVFFSPWFEDIPQICHGKLSKYDFLKCQSFEPWSLASLSARRLRQVDVSKNGWTRWWRGYPVNLML